MQRRMADAILKSYRENAKKHFAADVPSMARVPLLVDFCLGDLRSLERTIEEVDAGTASTNKA